jgi:hypothetical protein
MRGSSRSRHASIILLLLSTCALGLAATTGTTVQRQRSVLNKRKPLPALAGKAIKTRHAGRGRLSHRGGAAPAKPTDRRISLAFPIFAAFLYNLSIGFTIPVLPKVRFIRDRSLSRVILGHRCVGAHRSSTRSSMATRKSRPRAVASTVGPAPRTR